MPEEQLSLEEVRPMDPDPMQYVEEDDEKEKLEAKNTRKLNTLVAISVALLATFMAICKTKDDNIVQAMQQAQADKIDNYSWYQARNIREEIANATIAQLTAQSAAAPPQAQQSYQDKIKEYQAIVQDQVQKKSIQQADAEKADKTYNELNYHDDQFDLSDAMLALAISLLALTALTQKRWLFVLAMLPTFFGVVMGLGGLFGWSIHPNSLIRLLS
jgi:hypothetical protein